MSEQVMSALWTACCVSADCPRVVVAHTVVSLYLIRAYECTARRQMCQSTQGRCHVSHLYKHDTEPLYHRHTRRDLLKQLQIRICMLNSFSSLRFPFFCLDYPPFDRRFGEALELHQTRREIL